MNRQSGASGALVWSGVGKCHSITGPVAYKRPYYAFAAAAAEIEHIHIDGWRARFGYTKSLRFSARALATRGKLAHSTTSLRFFNE